VALAQDVERLFAALLFQPVGTAHCELLLQRIDGALLLVHGVAQAVDKSRVVAQARDVHAAFGAAQHLLVVVVSVVGQ
jgi:hypothetical protein